MKKQLFRDPSGPLVTYEPGLSEIRGYGTFCVSDLNPQTECAWRMSRVEMVKLGVRCILAALFG